MAEMVSERRGFLAPNRWILFVLRKKNVKFSLCTYFRPWVLFITIGCTVSFLLKVSFCLGWKMELAPHVRNPRKELVHLCRSMNPVVHLTTAVVVRHAESTSALLVRGSVTCYCFSREKIILVRAPRCRGYRIECRTTPLRI